MFQKYNCKLEQLETQKEQITSKYGQVNNMLKIAMGISMDQDFEVETEIVHSTINDYAQTQTLDSRLITKQNELINSELNSLKNSRLPSLSLYGSYAVTGFGYDKTPNEFLKFYPVSFAGIQLSYPLFNGMVSNKKINQKKLELNNNMLQNSLLEEKPSLLLK
ncbi:MAG: TolC family protein [Flammeovirgaceae bacterium]|nr:TolC family protein [Flammeovirgaceae bacterium]